MSLYDREALKRILDEADPTPLRLRVPFVELQRVVDTVGREAAGQRPTASAASE